MALISLTALALASAAPVGGEPPVAAGAAVPVPVVAAPVPHIEAAPLTPPPAPASAEEVGAPAPVVDTPPAEDAAAPEALPASAETLPAGFVLRDPWYKPNKAIWDFDIFFEKNLLGPVAKGYQTVAPQGVRNHLSNAILNLDVPSSVLNNLLQLKIGRAVKNTVRFVINSTVGIGGLFDVAEKGGLPARPADFGQTLARWGAKPGPYVMLPFLGPSNVRDGFGRLADTLSDPVGFVIGGIFTSRAGAARYLAGGVNWRQRNDSTMAAIYGASDPYAFARAAYAQQRAAVVQDATGKAPDLPDF